MNILAIPQIGQPNRSSFQIREILARWQARQRIRSDMRRLESMSDRDLRDIGIRRDQIRSALRHGRDWDSTGRR